MVRKSRAVQAPRWLRPAAFVVGAAWLAAAQAETADADADDADDNPAVELALHDLGIDVQATSGPTAAPSTVPSTAPRPASPEQQQSPAAQAAPPAVEGSAQLLAAQERQRQRQRPPAAEAAAQLPAAQAAQGEATAASAWQHNMQELSMHTDAAHGLAGAIGATLLAFGRKVPELLAVTSALSVGLWASLMVLEHQAERQPVMGVNVASFGLVGPTVVGIGTALIAGAVVCMASKLALVSLMSGILTVLVLTALRLANFQPTATMDVAGGKLPTYGIVAIVTLMVGLPFANYLLRINKRGVSNFVAAHLGVIMLLSAASHFIYRAGFAVVPFSLLDEFVQVYAEASSGRCVLWVEDDHAAHAHTAHAPSRCDCGAMCKAEILAWIIGSWCILIASEAYVYLNTTPTGIPYEQVEVWDEYYDPEPAVFGHEVNGNGSRPEVFSIADPYDDREDRRSSERDLPRGRQDRYDADAPQRKQAVDLLSGDEPPLKDFELIELRAQVAHLREVADSAGQAAARACANAAHSSARAKGRDAEVSTLRAEVQRMRQSAMRHLPSPPSAANPVGSAAAASPPELAHVPSGRGARGPPPAARGVPSAAALEGKTKFEGRWTYRGPQFGKHLNSIVGSELKWSDGNTAPLTTRPGTNSFTVKYQGGNFRAELINDQLVWDDGDIWVRYQ